jgi:DNA invertase Pin-like site-specific DNA recombinase
MIVPNGTEVYPMMFGYIRVRDSESDDELRYRELALRACAELEGYRLALIFHEYGAQQAFSELVEACQRQDVHHVIVQSIRDLSEHPLIRAYMLARLDQQAGVSVLSLGGRL